MRLAESFFFFLIVLAIPLGTCWAQETASETDNACNPNLQQPGDLTLRISVKNGQRIFRQGEIITLVAEYSSTNTKKYLLSTRNYDRSGRLQGTEVFCIDPSGGEDPLSDYFKSGSFMMGGLSSDLDPGEKPFVIEIELNEWKSLPPGSYRLSIEGRRIGALDREHAEPIQRNIPLRSDEVDFQIIEAEPAWQAEQLALAEKELDSGEPDVAKHAARVLRFLGSEAATRELARRYYSGEQEFGWDFKFGLFGSPHRSDAIAGLKAAIRAPQHPVTGEMVQTLSTLELQSDPKTRLPAYDHQDTESWRQINEAYEAALKQKMGGYMSDAAAAMPGKIGKARGVTASTLLQSETPLDSVARLQLRQALMATWASLPVRKQNELIEYRWEEVGGAEWLPILRGIVGGEVNPSRSFDKANRAVALRRIYEIAPDQGRAAILHEIASPGGDIGIDVLGLLPDKELPQVQQQSVAKMKAGSARDLDFQLLERYGGQSALTEAKTFYEAHGYGACVPQTAMLRYFLRVDTPYGIRRVSEAMSMRKVTGCYQFLFTSLEEYVRIPKIEQIAIDALNDPSVLVVRNAAEALQRYGSRKAESALWARLEKFHQQWIDKPEELQYRRGASREELEVIGLEQVLVQSIANGQAWFATADTIHRLKDLSSPQIQPELDQALDAIERGDYSLSLSWFPPGAFFYNVGPYAGRSMAALKEKLAQFPAGTHFTVVTTMAERRLHAAEFAEVEQAAANGSMILDIQTAR